MRAQYDVLRGDARIGAWHDPDHIVRRDRGRTGAELDVESHAERYRPETGTARGLNEGTERARSWRKQGREDRIGHVRNEAKGRAVRAVREPAWPSGRVLASDPAGRTTTTPTAPRRSTSAILSQNDE